MEDKNPLKTMWAFPPQIEYDLNAYLNGKQLPKDHDNLKLTFNLTAVVRHDIYKRK